MHSVLSDLFATEDSVSNFCLLMALPLRGGGHYYLMQLCYLVPQLFSFTPIPWKSCCNLPISLLCSCWETPGYWSSAFRGFDWCTHALGFNSSAVQLWFHSCLSDLILASTGLLQIRLYFSRMSSWEAISFYNSAPSSLSVNMYLTKLLLQICMHLPKLSFELWQLIYCFISGFHKRKPTNCTIFADFLTIFMFQKNSG